MRQEAKEVIPVLISALKDENSDVRSAAAYALGNMGKEAIPALIAALKDEDSDVRLAAAEALGNIGQPVKEAIPVLISALKDEIWTVRSSAAAEALGNMGKETIPALIAALKDEDRSVRLGVARALGNMGEEAKEAIPALIAALKDENSDVRPAAAKALGNVALGAIFSILGTIGVITGIVNSSLAIALKEALFLRKQSLYFMITYIVGAIVGASFSVREPNIYFSLVLVGIVVIVVLRLGVFIGLESIKDKDYNQKYWLIHWLTFTLIMKGGTKFVRTTLTNANFRGASLYYTDFTNAQLEGTCWEDVKGLRFTLRKTIHNYEILYLNSDHPINPNLAAKAINRLIQKYSNSKSQFKSLYLETVEAKAANELIFCVIITEGINRDKLSRQLNKLYNKLYKDYYCNPSNFSDDSKSEEDDELTSKIGQARLFWV